MNSFIIENSKDSSLFESNSPKANIKDFQKRLLVTLEPNGDSNSLSEVPATTVSTLSAIAGVKSVVVLSRRLGVVLLELDAESDAEKVTQGIAAQKCGVAFAENDTWAFPVEFVPSDPEFPMQYGLERIGMPQVWADFPPGDSEITVAVIDSG